MKARRSRLRSSSSSTPGSWNGTRPDCSASIRSGTTSRITTSWPSSAKQAPVTRPTQPAPKMPIFGFTGEEPTGAAAASPRAIASIVSFESESSSVFTTQ